MLSKNYFRTAFHCLSIGKIDLYRSHLWSSRVVFKKCRRWSSINITHSPSSTLSLPPAILKCPYIRSTTFHVALAWALYFFRCFLKGHVLSLFLAHYCARARENVLVHFSFLSRLPSLAAFLPRIDSRLSSPRPSIRNLLTFIVSWFRHKQKRMYSKALKFPSQMLLLSW